MHELVKKAGEELRSRYNGDIISDSKEKYDLVTRSDVDIERILVDGIKALYPDDAIFSEESGTVRGGSRRWIIDPIDGTAYFVFGVPFFSISLCLESQGTIIEGYVYNPLSEEFFHSIRAEGVSYLNGKPIHVSATSLAEESLVAFGFSANYQTVKQYRDEWGSLFRSCKKGVPLIAPALSICNVARGRADAFIDSGSSMEGQAAAALILENAGGFLLNYDLTPYDYRTKGLIASNGNVDYASWKGRG